MLWVIVVYKGENMQWSADNTPTAIQGKSLKLRELFAKVANASLAKGFSKEESIFAGTNAVKIEERKNQPAKVKAPKLPSHVESLRSYTNPFEMVSKAETAIEIPTVKAAEFDAQGHLVILMSDGRRVVTKGKAVEQHIDQRIGVSVNPVFDHVQMNTTANYTAEDRLPGMLTWNEFEDCLDIVQSDGTLLQVGLEQYIEVINKTASTMNNGSVVRFSGVSLEEIPEATPLIADGSIPSLYIIGILTNTLIPGQRGRATILGKVRNLNTTGSDVGETWQKGTLLWAHPTMPGKLTSVQPTAPNVVISVAAVLKADATQGIILARPVIFPRLFYGVFSSSVTQTPPSINTPHNVRFENTDIASGIRIVDQNRITTDNAGLYSFDFRLQLTSSNSSKKEMYIWARKNGVDIPRSTSRVTVSGNEVELVPSWSFSMSMQISDYFELMYAVTDTAISINAPNGVSFAPSTPSATLRVSQINL
jgi:hypothetical protein